MYSVEEIWEEQERQYNQLMQEDDQYCHPESFRWGFEHGFEYALSKFGWHPASELPIIPEGKDEVETYCLVHGKGLTVLVPMKLHYTTSRCWRLSENIIVKWWCYQPKEE